MRFVMISDFGKGRGIRNSTPYHDDMFDNKSILILPFPYIRFFGDFRIFNGVRLSKMDEIIKELTNDMEKLGSNISEAMVEGSTRIYSFNSSRTK